MFFFVFLTFGRYADGPTGQEFAVIGERIRQKTEERKNFVKADSRIILDK